MKIYSFGYKYEGEKPEVDMTFDLRNKLKNPVSHIPKGAIGLDKLVIDTVLGSDQNKKAFEVIFSKVRKQAKKNPECSVAFGCHSGIHRSVVFAEELLKRLQKLKISVDIEHIHLKV
jgi:RNase adaptor protein for sRNA GlmZ degradation